MNGYNYVGIKTPEVHFDANGIELETINAYKQRRYELAMEMFIKKFGIEEDLDMSLEKMRIYDSSKKQMVSPKEYFGKENK